MTALIIPDDSGPVFLTTAEVAERYRTTPSSVRHWRQVGIGPDYLHVGKRCLYPLEALEAWEASRIHHPQQEPPS